MERDRREPGAGMLVPILIFTVMVTSIAAAVLYMRSNKIVTSTAGLQEEVEQLKQAHAGCDKKVSNLESALSISKKKEAEIAKKHDRQVGEISSLSRSFESWKKKAETLKRENTTLKTLNYKSGRDKDKKYAAAQLAKAEADRALKASGRKVKLLEEMIKKMRANHSEDLETKNAEIRALEKEIENYKANQDTRKAPNF